MGAILVDQITALYFVLAVAFVVFGGIYAYLWWLSSKSGLDVRGLGAGFAAIAVLAAALFSLHAVNAVTTVEVMQVVAAVSVLAVWIILYVALRRLNGAMRS
jgi:hypothetical protein